MASAGFTPQQMQEYKKHFASFDVDGNGHIDENELRQIVKNLGEFEALQKLPQIIAEVDLNRNGTIEYEEFLHIMGKVSAGTASKDSSFVKVYEKQKELIQHKGHSGVHSFSQEEMTAFAEHLNYVLEDDDDCKHLLPINPEGVDLCDKVRDGVLLLKFINKAVPDTIDMRAANLPRKKPLNKFEINENMELAINAAKGIGVRVVNVGGAELQVGKQYPHLVLGIIWQLVKIQLLNSINLRNFPELARLLEEGETLEDLMKLPPDQLLLRWFNYHLREAGHHRRVNNFGPDLKDSENYTVLMHQIAPGRCAKDHLSSNDMHFRAQNVLENGKKIGVHAFIKPTDIVKGNQRLNLAFTASIFNACPGLDPLEEAIQIEEIEETREEKAFRLWMNSLGIDGVFLNHLYDGLMDGMALLKIMDHIEPGIVNWKKRVEMKPNNKFKKVANCNYAVEVGREGMQFSLVGIGGPDIVDGNKKLVLAIVWQLMRYHSTKLLSELQFNGQQASDDQIIQWANAKVEEGGKEQLRMRSLKDSNLSDSLFFINLLHAVNDRVIKWENVNRGANEEEKMLNARYAITTARKIGATVFLLPEDILEVNPKLILTFVAGIMTVALRG